MRQSAVILCLVGALVGATALPRPHPAPDSAGVPPLPGPGLSYGGIPYGSMSGNVAEYFRRQVSPSGRYVNFAGLAPSSVDYSPIEQWL